jgi:ubiquinone/menaquinone biosynthesis C-methylase UbiE
MLDVGYTGMDITPKLVEYNISKNINCVLGSINNIPFEDNSFDIVHSRGVVEHMSSIEKPLDEMIRVAIQKVFISFFIKPTKNSEHKICLDNEGTKGEVYHNAYSKIIIEKHLNDNTKVKDFRWMDLPDNYELLIINLK